MPIEVLILIAIIAEIAWSIYDRGKQNKLTDKNNEEQLNLLKAIKEAIEGSEAELADIRDATVEDETVPES